MMHLYSPNIYSSVSLEKFVLKNKLIPRKLRYNEHLKLFHKYWIEEYGIVKIVDVFDYNYTEYYIIKYGDRLDACLPYPISSATTTYELLKNDDHIENIKFGKSSCKLTGAELKYWLLHSGIELTDNIINQYKDLVDNKLYNIYRNPRTNQTKISL